VKHQLFFFFLKSYENLAKLNYERGYAEGYRIGKKEEYEKCSRGMRFLS
jgi:hypothetical protein